MTIFNTNKIIENGGITLKLLGLDLVNSLEVGGNYWYFPLLPDCTLLVGEDQLSVELEKFMLDNSAELLKRGRYLGVWLNPKDKKYYIDINVRSKTERGALKRVTVINKSSTRKILVIYNPATNIVVEV